MASTNANWLAFYDQAKLNATLPPDYFIGTHNASTAYGRQPRVWSGKPKLATLTIGDHFNDRRKFSAFVTATLRDDGDTWLDICNGGRYRITASDPLEDDHHREGWFYGRVWSGTATFAPTPDGLWLINDAFTAVIYPPDTAYGRGVECVCRACRQSAPEAHFRKTRSGGREAVCAACRAGPIAKTGRILRRTRGGRSTAASRARLNVGVPAGHKVCPSCLAGKPATKAHFTPDPRTADGLQHRCRACSGTVAGLAWKSAKVAEG